MKEFELRCRILEKKNGICLEVGRCSPRHGHGTRILVQSHSSSIAAFICLVPLCLLGGVTEQVRKSGKLVIFDRKLSHSKL